MNWKISPPSPPKGGISSNVIWEEKYEKGKEKGGNVREKGRK
jgi:hypothetical protein